MSEQIPDSLGPKKSEEIKITVAEGIRTKGDKARATSRLHEALIKEGLAEEKAGELATHELSHQRAHRGTGLLGYQKNIGKRTLQPFYDPDDRSPENMIKIAIAPDRGETAKITSMKMSPGDVEVVKIALQRQRQARRSRT